MLPKSPEQLIPFEDLCPHWPSELSARLQGVKGEELREVLGTCLVPGFCQGNPCMGGRKKLSACTVTLERRAWHSIHSFHRGAWPSLGTS